MNSSNQRMAFVTWDPQVERATVLVRITAGVLAASFVTAIGLSLVALAQTPLGWILVGVSALVGTYPAVAHLRRSRGRERLSIQNLPPDAAGLLTDAIGQTERLNALATASPPGPVADHLEHLAITADRYVLALHTSLCQVHPSGAANNDLLGRPGILLPSKGVGSLSGQLTQSERRELGEDVKRLVGQLTELADAATKLRQTQRQYLESSPLEALTEDTRRLAEVIAETQGLKPEVP